MDIVKVNPAEYGLEENKAKEISKMFKPMLDKMEELETEFNEVVKMDLSPEAYKKAKETRLKYVKVRTGTAQIHKDAKAYTLKMGRFIDGWKNTQELASHGKEEALAAIENHEAILEKQRIAELQEKRLKQARKWDPDFNSDNLGDVSQDFWENILAGVEARYLKRIKEEKEAKEEAIIKEKTEKLHKLRKDSILDLWKYVPEANRNMNFGEVPKIKWDKFKKYLEKQESISILHEKRKAELLPYWNYMNLDLQRSNFGTWETDKFIDLIVTLKGKDATHQAQRAVERLKAEEEEQKRIKAEEKAKKLKAKLDKQKEKEKKQKAEEEAKNQAELNKNDIEKFKSIIEDINSIEKKYNKVSFEKESSWNSYIRIKREFDSLRLYINEEIKDL